MEKSNKVSVKFQNKTERPFTNDKQSAVDQPLIQNSNFPVLNGEVMSNQKRQTKKKEKRFYIAIFVLTAIVLISLIAVVLLLIERNASLGAYFTTSPAPDRIMTKEAPRISKPSPSDLVAFIRDGLNTSVSPCQDFYGHVCSSHNSSSSDILRKQFYRLIMPAIISDTKHPEVSSLLQYYVQECARSNRSNVLKQQAMRQYLADFGLLPISNETVDKNFNFMLPLTRILFYPTSLNKQIKHDISYGNYTVAFYSDPENYWVKYREYLTLLKLAASIEYQKFDIFLNRYLDVFNLTLNEKEQGELQRFAITFQALCAQSVINGSQSEVVYIQRLRNIHFKQALEKVLPLCFRRDLTPSRSLFGQFWVSVDQGMIDNLQQFFATNPRLGHQFLTILALSAFNDVTLSNKTDTWEWDSKKEGCFFATLSQKRFGIFNLYAAKVMLSASFPMTQVSDQMVVRNLIEKIRHRIREKLLSTTFLKTDRELLRSLDKLMETKKAVGLPETAFESPLYETTYEVDRFELFLSLYKRRQDRDMLVHLSNSRLEQKFVFKTYFDFSASYDGETMEISHMYMQRPFFAVQFPDSYNYGFLGNTIGHEFFHQFSPKRVNEFWQKNERYIESANCYTKFYDDICFDLSLYDSVTNGTKVREVCTKGSTDLGENMPDVEGARVAFETMRAELGEVALKERAIPEFHYTNEQMFFIAVAQLHCDKDLNNHQYLADEMLDEDPHASGNVRVNGIAMQMAEFADAFHCQPGDPMVTAEEEKCYLLPTD